MTTRSALPLGRGDGLKRRGVGPAARDWPVPPGQRARSSEELHFVFFFCLETIRSSRRLGPFLSEIIFPSYNAAHDS